MATQKQQQKKFGFRLMIAAIVIAAFFSIWYMLEKNNNTEYKSETVQVGGD